MDRMTFGMEPIFFWSQGNISNYIGHPISYRTSELLYRTSCIISDVRITISDILYHIGHPIIIISERGGGQGRRRRRKQNYLNGIARYHAPMSTSMAEESSVCSRWFPVLSRYKDICSRI